MKHLLTSILLFALTAAAIAQNIGINSTGAAPDGSAMLDISSTTGGLLMPRMTTAERNAITAPATGLMVYDLTTQGFWYWDSTQWVPFGTGGASSCIQDTDLDTEVCANNSPFDHVRVVVDAIPRYGFVGDRIENWSNGVFIGQESGMGVFPDVESIHIGMLSGTGTATGSIRNTAVGAHTLTGPQNQLNTAIGYSSMRSASATNYNVAVGREVMQNSSAGDHNVAIGDQTMQATSSSSRNVCIGKSTAGANNNLNDNVAIGTEALFQGSSNHSIAIGHEALRQGTSIHNVAIGSEAMRTGIGSNSIALGRHAMRNGGGTGSVAIGHEALAQAIPHADVVAIGTGAARNLTTPVAGTIAIGERAMQNANHRGIAIGDSALFHNVGDNNIGIGYSSLRSAPNNFMCKNNIALGNHALLNTVAGQGFNIAVGHNTAMTGADSSITIGHSSHTNAGVSNIALGHYSIAGGSMSNGSIGIGRRSLFNAFATNSIAIGRSALQGAAPLRTIALGENAGRLSLSSPGAILVGWSSGEELNGAECVAIGEGSLLRGIGARNIALGFESAQNITGTENIFIGSNAANWSNGGHNVGVGPGVFGNFLTGHNNVAIGRMAMGTGGTGNDNVAIGYNARTFNSGNTVIGANAQTLGGVNNSSAIGFGASVSVSNAISIGRPVDQVGIGVAAPTERLDVAGGVRLANTASANPGTIRWTGADFEGYDGALWRSLTQSMDNDWTVTGINVTRTGGNVGIGTAFPNDRLVVTGGRVEFPTNTDANGTAGSGVLEIGNSLRIDNNEIITNTGTTLSLQFDNNGDLRVDNSTFMVDAGTNRVGINTLNPTHQLHVVGNGRFTGNVLAACGILGCSDQRYKKNIRPINDALSSLDKINGVRYKWKLDEFPDQGFTDEEQIGVIAQDLERVYPELVHIDEDGFRSVDYSKLTPILLMAIKEQQEQIRELRSRLGQIELAASASTRANDTGKP